MLSKLFSTFKVLYLEGKKLSLNNFDPDLSSRCSIKVCWESLHCRDGIILVLKDKEETLHQFASESKPLPITKLTKERDVGFSIVGQKRHQFNIWILTTLDYCCI